MAPVPVAPASTLETTMQEVMKAAREWTPPTWVTSALQRMNEEDERADEGGHRHGPGHGMMMV